MKKSLFLFTVINLLCVSCSTIQTYYQVCEVQSSLQTNLSGSFEFMDEACSVAYDFWCNGGNPGFVFSNNTDEIIYVDLSKSFFIKNGVAYDYFLNRTVSSSSSYIESLSASKNGAVYGYWNTLGGLMPGLLAASNSKGSSASQTSTIETAEKSIIAIPPHCSKVFTQYVISSSTFYECDYNIMPSKKETPTYTYQLLNSPLTFGNYITYRLGNDKKEHVINNDFYIQEVSFNHEKSIVTEQTVGCPNDKHTVKVIKGASPTKFYISYIVDLALINAQENQTKLKKKKEFSNDDWL